MRDEGRYPLQSCDNHTFMRQISEEFSQKIKLFFVCAFHLSQICLAELKKSFCALMDVHYLFESFDISTGKEEVCKDCGIWLYTSRLHLLESLKKTKTI